MHEDVARSVIGGNEAVALFRVEPLHSSLRHACSPRALSAGGPRGGTPRPSDPAGGMRFCPVRCRADHQEKSNNERTIPPQPFLSPADPEVQTIDCPVNVR